MMENFPLKNVFYFLFLGFTSFAFVALGPLFAKAQSAENLNGACISSSQAVVLGEPITFSAEALGGTGSYSFVWAGSENVSGTGQSITVTFDSPGVKTIQVFITSGNQTVSPECTVEVISSSEGLSGSCFPHSSAVFAGVPVVWTAQVSGGQGRISYSWSGTDNLSGRRRQITRIYDTPGIKTAHVLVNAGDQSMIRSCSVVVESPPPLNASCSPDLSVSPVGRTLTWTVEVSGGISEYSFSWSGADNLSGGNQAVSKNYISPGTKTANVHIISGNQSATVSCSAEVREFPGIIYGDEVPDTPAFPDTPSDSETSSGTGGEASVSGLALGGRILYWVFLPILLLWAVLIGYIIYQKREASSKDKAEESKKDKKANKSIPSVHEPTLTQALEERAKDSHILISVKGIEIIKEASENDKEKALKIMDDLIAQKKKFAKENHAEENWDILDNKEIKEFLNNGK